MIQELTSKLRTKGWGGMTRGYRWGGGKAVLHREVTAGTKAEKLKTEEGMFKEKKFRKVGAQGPRKIVQVKGRKDSEREDRRTNH